MRAITYKTRQGEETHEILTPKEAEDRGLPYLKDYQNVEAKGDLILTDDGFVVEVLALGRSPRTKMRWIRTCIGTFAIDTKTSFVDTKPRTSRFTFSGKTRSETHKHFTIEWTAFAEYIIRGYRPVDAYKMVYPATNSERYAKEKALLLMSRKEVKKIMNQKLGEVFEEMGIDDRFLIAKYKRLVERADSDSVSLQALNALSEMKGIKGQKTVQTTQKVFLGIPKEELAEIEDGVNRVYPPEMKELPTVKEDDDEVTLEDGM